MTLRQELKKLLSESKIEEVFEIIDDRIYLEPREENDFISYKGSYNSVRKQYDRGTVTDSYFRTQCAKTTQSLLEFIDDLDAPNLDHDPDAGVKLSGYNYHTRDEVVATLKERENKTSSETIKKPAMFTHINFSYYFEAFNSSPEIAKEMEEALHQYISYYKKAGQNKLYDSLNRELNTIVKRLNDIRDKAEDQKNTWLEQVETHINNERFSKAYSIIRAQTGKSDATLANDIKSYEESKDETLIDVIRAEFVNLLEEYLN